MSTLFWKRTLDLLMFVLFIVLMGCTFTGDVVHEYIGLLIFILFVVHHVLNGSWYRTFVNRCRTPRQFVYVFMTLLLFVVMIMMAISSVIVSRTVFSFIDYDGGLFARQFHQMATHFGLILTAFHFGIYGKRFFSNPGQKYVSVKEGRKVIRPVFVLLTAAICLYGIWASFRHDLVDKLLMKQAYSFWDGSCILFFCDYVAIFVLYATIAHLAVKRLFSRSFGQNLS